MGATGSKHQSKTLQAYKLTTTISMTSGKALRQGAANKAYAPSLTNAEVLPFRGHEKEQKLTTGILISPNVSHRHRELGPNA